MIIRTWFRFWLWVAYTSTMRRRWNTLLRWLDRGEPKRPLAALDHPAALARHIARWQWRRDGTRIGGVFVPLDYVSAPEVTEARLHDGIRADGDCDDAHHYAAVQLSRMPDVAAAYHVTIGYRGGGHMACVYRFRGSWWLLNYGKIYILQGGPHDAQAALMQWAGGTGERPRWLVFEDVTLRRVRL